MVFCVDFLKLHRLKFLGQKPTGACHWPVSRGFSGYLTGELPELPAFMTDHIQLDNFYIQQNSQKDGHWLGTFRC